MSVHIKQLQDIATDFENRASYAFTKATIFGGITFGSYTLFIDNPSFIVQLLFVLVGGALGAMHGMDTKRRLENHLAVVSSLLSLYNSQQQTSSAHNQLIASEDVQIPSQPNVPNLPSAAVPAEVREVLKTSKAKAKPTIVAPAQEEVVQASSETKKVVMKRKAK